MLRRRQTISFESLAKAAGAQLAELEYDQRPVILGPGPIVKTIVPWRAKP